MKYFKVDENWSLWLAGGAKTYENLIWCCTNAEATRVLSNLNCDCFFPDLSQIEGWELVETSDVMEEDGMRFVYEKWTNFELLEWLRC